MVSRFDVFLVTLDPTVGAEIKKTRPCVVISPDVMHNNVRTVIIAPMTSKGRPYATRVETIFKEVKGLILLDQLRAVDQKRLVKKLGKIPDATARVISDRLVTLFEF
jgi:mRNA interferase MazF